MELLNTSRCPEVSGDFILEEWQNHPGDIVIFDGSLTVKPNAAFLSTVTFIDKHKPVVLENHSFIYHLLMMNGGELFFKGDNIMIDQLTTEDNLVVHVPKSCDNWRKMVNTVSGVRITVLQDID